MTLVLYHHDLLADAYKARLLFALSGIAYEARTVAMLPGDGPDRPEHRALDPDGSVPLLVDGDLVVARPEAILVYVAETRAPARAWLPADPTARAATFDWLFFAAGPLRAAEAARLASLFGDRAAVAAPAAAARRALRTLEAHLRRRAFAGEAFLAGAAPSLADLAVFPSVALAADIGIEMDEFPGLVAWRRRIHALPGFVAMPGVPEVA